LIMVQMPVSECSTTDRRKILGISFLLGTAEEMVTAIMAGGLVVVPSGPGLKDLPVDRAYREALLNADFAITDSAFMVLLWNILQGDRVPRVSGLYYLQTLLRRPELRASGASYWVMPGRESSDRNLAWLCTQGIHVPEQNVYLAPRYLRPIEDSALVRRLETQRPAHVFLCVGGGVQEPLGHYLKRSLEYRPSIHCIGAAIAFLSGDQVSIPNWMDRAGLGWLARCLSHPRVYVPRYWSARKLAALMIRYRAELPPLRG
jgi:N-acetylglucosaminyldiphosphoundecaprenol N-acetyl-beta-D-mannosaminyltransferase